MIKYPRFLKVYISYKGISRMIPKIKYWFENNNLVPSDFTSEGFWKDSLTNHNQLNIRPVRHLGYRNETENSELERIESGSPNLPDNTLNPLIIPIQHNNLSIETSDFFGFGL